MEHMEWWSMLANASVQAINIVIFFGIFRYFFGKNIKKSLQKKRVLLEKLDNADAVYEEIIARAHTKKQEIIDEALQHKQSVLEETKILAEKRDQELLESTKIQAENILHEAHKKAEQIQAQLEEWFIDGVKRTARMVVDKIFKKDVQLNEKYVETLAREFSS